MASDKDVRELMVQEINNYPPDTIMILPSAYSESILMYLVDHFPISSPIMFQCNIPEQTVIKLAKHMAERRSQGLVLLIDPQSSESQSAYLVKAFKPYQFVIYMAFPLEAPVLHSVVQGLGFGQGIRLSDDLPEDILRSTIPLIPAETILYLSEHMQEETVAIIARLLLPTVRVSFLGQNIPLNLAETLAKNAKTGCYLHVSQDATPIQIAQTLARNLNKGAILYCASGKSPYMQAIASSLKAGGTLVFHPSISFGDVLKALKYMRAGTLLGLGHVLDEEQIELFINAIENDVGILFDESSVSQEVREQITNKLASKKLNGTPESTQKISSALSLFSSETKRISDLNKAKATNFFAAQFDPNGPFHNALESIMQNTTMDQYEIIQYFIDKFSGASFVYNPSLENAVSGCGFRLLVSFEDELRNITEVNQLAAEFVDSSKKILTNQLQNLKKDITSMSINSIGID